MMEMGEPIRYYFLAIVIRSNYFNKGWTIIYKDIKNIFMKF